MYYHSSELAITTGFNFLLVKKKNKYLIDMVKLNS